MITRGKNHISIVLVDDNRLARDELTMLIRTEPGFRALTTSTKIEMVTRTVRRTRPDLVLLNLGREGDDRLTLTGALHETAPEIPVVVMGLAPRGEDVEGLVRAGVAGFIMANASFAVYLATIHLIAAGSRVLPPGLTHLLFGQINGPSVPRGRRSSEPVKRIIRPDHASHRLEIGTLSTPLHHHSPAFDSLN